MKNLPGLSRREMSVLTTLAKTNSTQGLSPLTVRKLHSLGLLVHDNHGYGLTYPGQILVQQATLMEKLLIDARL